MNQFEVGQVLEGLSKRLKPLHDNELIHLDTAINITAGESIIEFTHDGTEHIIYAKPSDTLSYEQVGGADPDELPAHSGDTPTEYTFMVLAHTEDSEPCSEPFMTEDVAETIDEIVTYIDDSLQY